MPGIFVWNGREFTTEWTGVHNGETFVSVPINDYRSGYTAGGDGLTSTTPGTNAWQIKQDYPASADGVYWIQNDSINDAQPFQVYCDMTTNGGGWTLVLQNNFADNWTKDTALSLNPTTPPGTLVEEGTYGTDDSANYSIYGWADAIKRSASGFDYMLEAYARGRNGGIWTANQAYNFMDKGSNEDAYWGEDFTTNSGGFHQDITEVVKFPAGSSTDTGTWNYDNNSIEYRMPWYADPDVCSPGNALITTTHNDSYAWFGTLVSNNSYWTPAPWIASWSGGPVDISKPSVIWMWVR